MNALSPFRYDGEVLGRGDCVRVIGAPHPLKAERVAFDHPAGATVAELLDLAQQQVPSRLPKQMIVYLDGHVIPEANWPRLRPKAGTTLTFRALVQKKALTAIVSVLLIVAAFVIAGPLGGAAWLAGSAIGTAVGLTTATATSLIIAGVTIAGSLAMSALFPPAKPKQDAITDTATSQTKTAYSIGGARNEVKPFGAVPTVLGFHRMSPAYAAQPYTEIVGEDIYLRLLFCWGYGPVDIGDLRIGETPLSNFSDVEVETRYGYPGDPAITLYPRQAIEEQFSIELGPGAGVFTRATAADVDEIGFDLTAPQGVWRLEKASGLFEYHLVRFRARFRILPFGDWQDWATFELGSAVQDPIRYGLRRWVPRGQYEIELLNLSNPYSGEDQVSEAVYWTAVRGFRNESPVDFDKPLALTALRIKASGQLNGAIDTFNGLVSAQVKAWSGTAWVDDSPSSNPANLFRHVLQGPANARPVPDALLDLSKIQSWASWCFARGYTFNQIRWDRTSVWELLREICAAGRAVPSFVDGKWSVIYDDSASLPVVQHFTPRNSSQFSGSRAYRRMPHGWRVRFVNAENEWQQDERIVYDDGYNAGNATLFEAIEFPGVTDPDLIWRHGRYHLAQARLQPETYTIKADFENLVCTRGDRVRISHDVPLIGQIAARVTWVDQAARLLRLDESVTLLEGRSYGMRFRFADGSAAVHRVTSPPGERPAGADIALGISSEIWPAVGDLAMFGEYGQESAIMRVLSIMPGADLSATLTLVDDAPGIALAESGAIPDFDSHVTPPIDPLSLGPTRLIAKEYLYAIGSGARTGAILSWSILRFSAVTSFEVQIRDDGRDGLWRTAQSVPPEQLSATILDLSPGHYSFRVRALFGDRTASGWATVTNVALDTLDKPPPDVTGFRISVSSDIATLTWDVVQRPDVSHYQIRFAPVLSGASWAMAAPLLGEVYGTQAQIPSQVGTYLIKAVTFSGLTSAGASLLSSNVASLVNFNVVETLTEHPTFAGVKTDVSVIDDPHGLALVYFGDVFDRADWFGSADFFLTEAGMALEGVYLFGETIDLGAVDSSRVSALVEAFGRYVNVDWFMQEDAFAPPDWFGVDAEQWDAFVEMRTTQDDPSGAPTWTEWQRLVIGNQTARAYQFRARLISREFGLTPVVTRLSVTVDMPDRVVAGDDILVPAAGLDIQFDPPFRVLQGISTANQDLATGDRAVITDKGPGGFSIRFLDAGGAGVERTIDYLAKGYGRAS